MSRWLFTAVVVVISLARLVELGRSRRNTSHALARGGQEFGAGHYRWMVALHAAFLTACLAEVWLLTPPFRPWLAQVTATVLFLAMALRYWAITTLGPAWTTRIICVPGSKRIDSGPYRYLRHPNYVAVVLEVAALPMLHGAWRSAVAFTAANMALLAWRIRIEEAALTSCLRRP